MRRTIFPVLLLVTAVSGVGLAQTPPSAENGKVVFNKWCVYCHGAGRSRRRPVRLRCQALPRWASSTKASCRRCSRNARDLAPDFVRTVVRGGLFGMPISRKTEISDAELADVIAYLTRAKH